ncbi:MAG: leukotoxin LktA family filamentous adhesin, partial [Vampirovibrionia bacterium]
MKGYFHKFKKSSSYLNIANTCFCIALASTINLTPCYAQQIIIDGKTNTSITTTGTTTSVRTSSIKNKNAFNSFSKFDVNAGNTVNLVVPDSTDNLINLINDKSTEINGKLNSYHNGTIGGNVFLVNPYGITVGQQGVINVGSLNTITPTKDYMNSFFDSSGTPDDTSVNALLKGTTPINRDAKVINYGSINAIEDIKLDTGNVENYGEIYTGAVYDEQDVQLGDIVNLNKLENSSNIVVNNGNIVITTKEDFINAGKIVADGGNNINAGIIDIRPEKDAILLENSLISAKGKGINSNGGSITIFADNDSYFKSGSIIDSLGGEISGDGGFIELSANRNVNIAGTFKAYAYNGDAGSILIDPVTVDGSVLFGNSQYTHGADLTITATDTININNIIISTRQIAGGDTQAAHASDPSTGNSGNLI